MTYKMTLNKEAAKILAEVLDGWMGTVPEGDAHREALATIHDDLVRKLNAAVPRFDVEDLMHWVNGADLSYPPANGEALAEAMDEVADYCIAKGDGFDVLEYASRIIEDGEPEWVPHVLPAVRRIMEDPNAVNLVNVNAARRFSKVLSLFYDVQVVASEKLGGPN